VGIDQICKIDFQLFRGQLIRAAIKMFADPTDSPRIGIKGLYTILKFIAAERLRSTIGSTWTGRVQAFFLKPFFVLQLNLRLSSTLPARLAR